MPEYDVILRFEFPAWDERDGIHYPVTANSKRQAIDDARRKAKRDGHLPATGKGRPVFSAQPRGI